MALLIPARTAQDIKYADFVFNWNDTMLNAAGTSDEFKTVASHAFDAIPIPVGSIVVGGSVVTDTAITGSTAYNIIVGDSLATNKYLTTTDKVAAGYTALVPTGYRTVAASGNIRITIAPTVATATAGKVTLRVHYVTDGQADYVL